MTSGPTGGKGRTTERIGRRKHDDTPRSSIMSTQLNRIAELAHADATARFLSLAHLLTPEALRQAFGCLRKAASAGVDGVTYADYEAHAQDNIRQLPVSYTHLRAH